MLSARARFRFWIGIAAALGGAQLAGCCGGLFEDTSCSECGASPRLAANCPERDAAIEVATIDAADTGAD
jgi:hypothetical protein